MQLQTTMDIHRATVIWTLALDTIIDCKIFNHSLHPHRTLLLAHQNSFRCVRMSTGYLLPVLRRVSQPCCSHAKPMHRLLMSKCHKENESDKGIGKFIRG